MSFSGSPWITVGERERTHALHGEMLYPTISSAAPDASARASVGALQISTLLCESSLFPSLLIFWVYSVVLGVLVCLHVGESLFLDVLWVVLVINCGVNNYKMGMYMQLSCACCVHEYLVCGALFEWFVLMHACVGMCLYIQYVYVCTRVYLCVGVYTCIYVYVC